MEPTSQPRPLSIAEANAAMRSTARSVASELDTVLRRLGPDADAIALNILKRMQERLTMSLEDSMAALEGLAFGPLEDIIHHRESRA